MILLLRLCDVYGHAGSDIRSEGIEKRLKSVEGHIEAGRLLALYQVCILSSHAQ